MATAPPAIASALLVLLVSASSSSLLVGVGAFAPFFSRRGGVSSSRPVKPFCDAAGVVGADGGCSPPSLGALDASVSGWDGENYSVYEGRGRTDNERQHSRERREDGRGGGGYTEGPGEVSMGDREFGYPGYVGSNRMPGNGPSTDPEPGAGFEPGPGPVYNDWGPGDPNGRYGGYERNYRTSVKGYDRGRYDQVTSEYRPSLTSSSIYGDSGFGHRDGGDYDRYGRLGGNRSSSFGRRSHYDSYYENNIGFRYGTKDDRRPPDVYDRRPSDIYQRGQKYMYDNQEQDRQNRYDSSRRYGYSDRRRDSSMTNNNRYNSRPHVYNDRSNDRRNGFRVRSDRLGPRMYDDRRLDRDRYFDSYGSRADSMNSNAIRGGYKYASRAYFSVQELTKMGTRMNADVGNPQDAYRKLYDVGPTSCGSWSCTQGGWSSTKPRSTTKVFHILNGRACVTDFDGTKNHFGPGDTVIMPKDWTGRWDVLEDVHTIYVKKSHQDLPRSANSTSAIVVPYRTFSSHLMEDTIDPREGAPSMASRTVFENGHMSAGGWICSPGAFSVTDLKTTECFHILEGALYVSNGDGSARRCCVPGDTVVLPKGWSGQWEAFEPVKKLWVIAE